jgi:hypothetical protein
MPAPYAPGSTVRILIHRSGILPIHRGDLATVRYTGLRNGTDPYVAVTVVLPAGTVHTSFTPEQIVSA